MDLADFLSIMGGQTADDIEKHGLAELLNVLRQSNTAFDEKNIQKIKKDLYNLELRAGNYRCYVAGFGGDLVNGKERKVIFHEALKQFPTKEDGEQIIASGIVNEYGIDNGGWYITSVGD